MRRFFSPDLKKITGRDARHALVVMRLRKKDKVHIFDGRGSTAEGIIDNISQKPVEITLTDVKIRRHKKPAPGIRVYQAAIKPRPMGICVQKCTELGADFFMPLRCGRSFRGQLSRARLENVARDACGQSGRSWVPSLDEMKDFLIGIMDWKESRTAGFILTRGAEALKVPRGTRTVSIFTGPEGGFTNAEIKSALEAGLVPASVAENTLRSETASIAACALVRGIISGSCLDGGARWEEN